MKRGTSFVEPCYSLVRRRSRALTMALLALVVMAVTGCTKRDARPTPERIESLDYAGCAEVDRLPSCELKDDRAVRFRLPREWTFEAASFETEDGAVNADATPVSDARRVIAPPAARTLVVRASKGGTPMAWRLALRESAAVPPFITEARGLRAKGAFDDAARLIASQIGTLSGEPRATAESLLGRLEIVRGSPSAAEGVLRSSMDAHARGGHASRAAEDALALAFVLLEKRRFSDVRALLDRAAAWSRGYWEGTAQTLFYEGYLARDRGDIRAALPLFDKAIAMLDAMDLGLLSRSMRIERAATHAAVGMWDEALSALHEVEARADAPACQRADAALNTGWIELARNDATFEKAGTDDPSAPLGRALASYRDTCRAAGRVASALTALAWSHLQSNDPKRARLLLSEARASFAEPDKELALFWVELDGRIALAEHDARAALAAFDKLASAIAAAGVRGEAWRAAYGRAESLAMMGDTRAALLASADAEQRLEDESRGVPLSEGRAQFLGARERSARLRVGLLIDAGHTEAALAAARAARARVLADSERSERIAALDPAARRRWEAAVGEYRAARDALETDAAGDWSRSHDGQKAAATARAARDEEMRGALERAVASLPPVARSPLALPVPGTGTLLLAYFPLLRGWVGFASDGATTRAVRIASIEPSGSPADLSSTLLEPFHAAIVQATRIAIVALGPLEAVDVHALPFEGAPLVAHAAVEYAIDLAPIAPAAPTGAGSPRALVVADPTSDLPAARREGNAVADLFRASGTASVTFLSGHEATREAVQRAIVEADYLHYAGHGVFGGRDGSGTFLPLADDASLAALDVLALPRVPRELLLAGCNTGARSANQAALGIGMAQAFLAAGSESVVAATREVADGATSALFTDLARAKLASPSRDLVFALRDAQVAAIARDGTGADRDSGTPAWRAFRLIRR